MLHKFNFSYHKVLFCTVCTNWCSSVGSAFLFWRPGNEARLATHEAACGYEVAMQMKHTFGV